MSIKQSKSNFVGSAAEAYQYLLVHPEEDSVFTQSSEFRWGDAEAIALYPDGEGSAGYEGQIVLVELRASGMKGGRPSQFQHWRFRFPQSDRPEIRPTWFVNLSS